MKTVRFHAFSILRQFYQTRTQLKQIRNDYFSTHNFSPEDRNRLLVLTNEVVRWQGRLDLCLETALEKPLRKLLPAVHTILRIGTYELMLDKIIPDYAAIHSSVELTKQVNPLFTGLVNGVLRELAKVDVNTLIPEDKGIGLNARWNSFPDWLVERWIDQFGAKRTKQLISYFNQPAMLDIRLNLTEMQPDEFHSVMNEENIILRSFEDSDRFFRVRSGGQKIRNHPLLLDGKIAVQDRGAGGIVELLDPQPGETVLDVCAAPGTKTAYITERMNNEGQVLAYDIRQQRIPAINNSSSGKFSEIIRWAEKDARTDSFPVADRILVDAPCSGTGVIGRRPDIRWRRTPDAINQIAVTQLEILNNVSHFLIPGGILVYATCSLEEEENWKVVDAFLKLNEHFKVEQGEKWLPLQWIGKRGQLETFPPRDKIDGMFAVRLKYQC